jgi:glutaredoxin
VDYRNVKKSEAHLAEMLVHSRGSRQVPLIVEAGRVSTGYGGS